LIRHGDTVLVLAGAPGLGQPVAVEEKRRWVGRAATDVLRIVHVD
jgi:hypothetical protein